MGAKCIVTAPSYRIKNYGQRRVPPFEDIFEYFDDGNHFYFIAGRKQVLSEDPVKTLTLDAYTVTEMWCLDATGGRGRPPKTQIDRDEQMANVAEGLLAMRLWWHDEKPAISVQFALLWQT